jgi:hypothetical protein
MFRPCPFIASADKFKTALVQVPDVVPAAIDQWGNTTE